MPRYLWARLLTGVILALEVSSSALGGDPTPKDLIALAPVLDSSDKLCRSLDVGLLILEPKLFAQRWLPWKRPCDGALRLRAQYRAPDRFSLLVCDATDGTPFLYSSGGKMFVYDPVSPSLYYSEDAVFKLELACTKAKFKFDYAFSLRKGGDSHHILVDFRSILSGIGAAGDRISSGVNGQFEWTRTFLGGRPFSLTLNVDPRRESPYTAADMRIDGVSVLSFDRLALNDPLRDEWFAFPARQRLSLVLPLKKVGAEEDRVADVETSAVLGRASVVRSLVNHAGPSGPINIPGVSGMDWDQVRKNDKKYSKALRDLLPPNLQAPGNKQLGGKPRPSTLDARLGAWWDELFRSKGVKRSSRPGEMPPIAP